MFHLILFNLIDFYGSAKQSGQKFYAFCMKMQQFTIKGISYCSNDNVESDLLKLCHLLFINSVNGYLLLQSAFPHKLFSLFSLFGVTVVSNIRKSFLIFLITLEDSILGLSPAFSIEINQICTVVWFIVDKYYGVWVTLKKHGENSVPVDHLQRVTSNSHQQWKFLMKQQQEVSDKQTGAIDRITDLPVERDQFFGFQESEIYFA